MGSNRVETETGDSVFCVGEAVGRIDVLRKFAV